MQHILLTRFNLKINPEANNEQNIGLTEEWLAHRFEIFYELCLPSVLNQSKKNFLWIIFFDTHTPEIFKEKARALPQLSAQIKVIFIDGFKELNASLPEIIRPFIASSFVITTRLDNDDIIHQDFLETIGQLAIAKNDTVIDLTSGHQLELSSQRAIIRKHQGNFNPFISLVETDAQVKTVLSRMHNDWKNAAQIISYNQKPLWIVYIHGKNLANHSKWFLWLSNRVNFLDYGIKKYDFKYSQTLVYLFNIAVCPFNLMYKIYKAFKN